jgi:hypothetical protein
MSETFRSTGARMNRRVAMGALAAGASALVFGTAGTAAADDDSAGGSRVSWDDGWEYPIVGCDESGQWVVAFDEGEHLVDPSGWIHDDGVWHAISAVGDDGIWYIGNDGYEYLIDGFDSSTEYVV